MAKENVKGNEILELLNDLIELDYDAIEAYESAISRLDNQNDKFQLGIFMADHGRHVADLSAMVRELGGQPATKADIKQILTKGKVVLGALMGDKAILSAMKSNEDTTNEQYERALSHEFSPRIREILERNLADERKHRAWLLQRLGVMQHAHGT
jgi:uncharacterized protein (TIGR02284 family)